MIDEQILILEQELDRLRGLACAGLSDPLISAREAVQQLTERRDGLRNKIEERRIIHERLRQDGIAL